MLTLHRAAVLVLTLAVLLIAHAASAGIAGDGPCVITFECPDGVPVEVMAGSASSADGDWYCPVAGDKILVLRWRDDFRRHYRIQIVAATPQPAEADGKSPPVLEVEALRGVFRVTASDDGALIYAASSDSDRVTVLRRDPAAGLLTVAGVKQFADQTQRDAFMQALAENWEAGTGGRKARQRDPLRAAAFDEGVDVSVPCRFRWHGDVLERLDGRDATPADGCNDEIGGSGDSTMRSIAACAASCVAVNCSASLATGRASAALDLLATDPARRECIVSCVDGCDGCGRDNHCDNTADGKACCVPGQRLGWASQFGRLSAVANYEISSVTTSAASIRPGDDIALEICARRENGGALAAPGDFQVVAAVAALGTRRQRGPDLIAVPSRHRGCWEVTAKTADTLTVAYAVEIRFGCTAPYCTERGGGVAVWTEAIETIWLPALNDPPPGRESRRP